MASDEKTALDLFNNQMVIKIQTKIFGLAFSCNSTWQHYKSVRCL